MLIYLGYFYSSMWDSFSVHFDSALFSVYFIILVKSAIFLANNVAIRLLLLLWFFNS